MSDTNERKVVHLMESYEKWLRKEQGHTRATMSRKAYSKMMKTFSENELKRTNFRVSIKHFSSHDAYRKMRATSMREWRQTVLGQGRELQFSSSSDGSCVPIVCQGSDVGAKQTGKQTKHIASMERGESGEAATEICTTGDKDLIQESVLTDEEGK
jgi:hypothetical protein